MNGIFGNYLFVAEYSVKSPNILLQINSYRIFRSSPKLIIFTETVSAEYSAKFRPEYSARNPFRWLTNLLSQCFLFVRATVPTDIRSSRLSGQLVADNKRHLMEPPVNARQISCNKSRICFIGKIERLLNEIKYKMIKKSPSVSVIWWHTYESTTLNAQF